MAALVSTVIVSASAQGDEWWDAPPPGMVKRYYAYETAMFNVANYPVDGVYWTVIDNGVYRLVGEFGTSCDGVNTWQTGSIYPHDEVKLDVSQSC